MVFSMDIQSYTIFVAVLALVYSVFSRYVQQKFGNQKDMKEFQENSKRLQKEFEEATKSKDKKRTDEVMQKQMANFSIMNKALFGQFKIMAIVLVAFFGFMFIANTFDPAVADDFTINLVDDGNGCDVRAGDGVFSTCVVPDTAFGPWLAHITVHIESCSQVDGKELVLRTCDTNRGEVIQENYAWFSYGKKNGGAFYSKPADDKLLNVSFANSFVSQGGKTALYAKPTKGENVLVTAKLNRGTWFYIDLPFTIPIINVQRLNDPNGWFIFVSIIFGISASLVMSQINKLKNKSEKPADVGGASAVGGVQSK
ncbi:TPA: DUF106 domain-containing protein [Candidatus Woesearchaeota archaeon]|nr:DUF106 domain-containing protein [Candidatus Woesearchaeota archaeon]